MASNDNKLITLGGYKEGVKQTLAKAVEFNNGLAGGCAAEFPLTTASKNNIYRVPATNRYYVCVQDYSGSTISAPNSNFVELSVFKNADRLDKLVKIERFDSNTFGVSNLTGFGIALNCGNFCILAITLSNDTSSSTEINLKLPYKFQNAYAHVVDNDSDLINRTASIGWASNTLKYKNVLGGHTILIVGQIEI